MKAFTILCSLSAFLLGAITADTIRPTPPPPESHASFSALVAALDKIDAKRRAGYQECVISGIMAGYLASNSGIPLEQYLVAVKRDYELLDENYAAIHGGTK